MANVGNGEEAGTAPGAGLVIQDTDATGVVPSPFAAGAADGAPHTIRRMHVDGIEPVPGRSPADDLRVCWHEASHATIGRHWSELGGVTCQPGSGFAGGSNTTTMRSLRKPMTRLRCAKKLAR